MKKEKLTRFVKKEEAESKWLLVDATDQTLGRLASKIARMIRGKEKPTFTPNTDTGDNVVVINAEKIKLTGKRPTLKTYIHHSGYPGGLKEKSFVELMKTRPEFIIRNAVKGMLPKTRLGDKLIKKLKVYKGDGHPHKAQKPESISL